MSGVPYADGSVTAPPEDTARELPGAAAPGCAAPATRDLKLTSHTRTWANAFSAFLVAPGSISALTGPVAVDHQATLGGSNGEIVGQMSFASMQVDGATRGTEAHTSAAQQTLDHLQGLSGSIEPPFESLLHDIRWYVLINSSASHGELPLGLWRHASPSAALNRPRKTSGLMAHLSHPPRVFHP